MMCIGPIPGLRGKGLYDADLVELEGYPLHPERGPCSSLPLSNDVLIDATRTRGTNVVPRLRIRPFRGLPQRLPCRV